MLLSVAAAGPAAAQALRLEGRVLRADSTPLPGAWVVLHRVTMDGGGPGDSVQAGPTGAFRITVSGPDTTALYMVSTTYRGLTYFSEVRTGRDSGGPLDPLVVYDTSSTGPAIAVAQRHIVVRGGEGSVRRSVLELVALANDGSRTRIAGEPPRPTWVGRIPADAENFAVGQGDVSSEAVRRVGDSVVVTAPLAPGVKQLVFTYEVSGAELRFPIDQPADRLLVLLSDTAAVVAEGPLMRRGTEVFDDTQFAVFSGTATTAGGAMVFQFSRRRFTSVSAAAVIAGAAALLLLLAIPLLTRRTPPAVRAAPPETPETLARAIALLDAEHEQGPPSPAADETYRARRAELKQRLTDLLARRSAGA